MQSGPGTCHESDPQKMEASEKYMSKTNDSQPSVRVGVSGKNVTMDFLDGETIEVSAPCKDSRNASEPVFSRPSLFA